MDTTPRNGIVTGGLWLIDSTKHIDHYPAPSRLATVREVVRSNGGGAFNVAVNLSKLRAAIPLHAVGLIGDDENGRWILERCRNHNITTDALSCLKDQPTACTDVMTEIGTGRRTFFYLPGASVRLKREHFDFSTSTARIFYLGYPGLLSGLDEVSGDGRSGLEAVLADAQQAGLATAVDLVSSDRCDWKAIARALPRVDVLFANEWEAAQMLERDAAPTDAVSAAELHELGSALLDAGVRQAVVVHCSRGAICVSRDGGFAACGAVNVSAEEIRGTCGAGDALSAGFLLAFHWGRGWAECLELGISAAATCLHHLTSSEGVRPWEECLAYGRRVGFQKF